MEIKNEEEKMIAYCGMNCSYCYVHQKNKKPCPGCRHELEGKPEHCRKCKIKDCANEKHVLFCSDCPQYPCVLIKRLDKSYQTRYKESLINNMKIISEKGMSYYLETEKVRLKCSECGGVLNIHDKQCSGCGKVRRTND